MHPDLIDTHAHLTSEQIFPHLTEILQRAQKVGVCKIVNICTDIQTLERGLALHRYPWVYNTAATTPHDVETEGEEFFPYVAKAAKEKKLIAIGETGLDYFYEHSNKKVQQDFLIRYFALAKEMRLPLIFHCREAFCDLFALADTYYAHSSAVLHCFTGTQEEARGVLDRGWYLSFSGIVTFKKSESLREIAKYVPLDRIFIETDSPYLAPQNHRGKQNEPSFLIETAEAIAHIKRISLEDLMEACKINAAQFFSFPETLYTEIT